MELSFRGSVNRWECDENDHLNVRFYVEKHWQTLTAGLASLGLLESADGAEMLSRISVQHLRFLREARISAPISGYWGVVKRGFGLACDDKIVEGTPSTSIDSQPHIQVVTELRDSFTDEPFCSCIHTLRDCDHAINAELLAHATPRGVASQDIPHAQLKMHEVEEFGFRTIGLGIVQKSEVANNDISYMHTYMGRLSDAMPHLWGALNAARGGIPENEGGAVLEYRLRYHRPLERGNRFSIHSGIAGAGEKLQHFSHLLFDVASGEVCVSASTVGVRMDLQARKAIILGESVRQLMRDQQIKSIS